MSNIKKDFPILKNNPNLIYLDSTATTQKPNFVIDGVKEYLETGYANIHRGSYDLSTLSEKLYVESKQKVADFLGTGNWREVIYTMNSTYAINILTQSIRRSKWLKKGDKVLLSIVEHHANIVPWLILKEELGIEIEYIKLKDDYSLDFDDLESKLDDTIKVVSLAHVSNTTGEVFDLEKVGKLLKKQKEKPLFVVDGSQSFPHFQVDIEKIGCDFFFFTGHKIMADTGIGVLWGREKLLEKLHPCFSGGGAIAWVKEDSFQEGTLPDKFEFGTPNLTGAVSLLRALEYVEKIGGYKRLEEIEEELVTYALEKFENMKGITLIGGKNPESRVGVFGFMVDGIHSFDISDYLADNDICIRAGQHCAEPFLSSLGLKHTCRMSLYIYNTEQDVDRFFEVLNEAIINLK